MGFYADKKTQNADERQKTCTVGGFVFLCGCGFFLAVYLSGKSVPVAAAADNAAPASPDDAAGTSTLKGKLIVLDAGHGGFDIGATGLSGVHEDDLNLKMALYLKAEMESAGARVLLTRENEDATAETKDADMEKRREIIVDSESDIVVSIHMNTAKKPEVSGPVALFMPGSVQGEKLAETIQKCMIEELKPASQNSARSEEFYILESGAQPCVIVECGFLSNAAEEALLADDAYQRKVARAIADGCTEYFKLAEK